MTVFLGINFVITPPTVSIPRVSGATSKRRISGQNSEENVNFCLGIFSSIK